MQLHHVGIVVRDLEASADGCRTLLGLHPSSCVFQDPIQKVRVQFWQDREGNTLELVQPIGTDSPVNEALRKGGGLNHLCFEVEDIDAHVHTMVEKGAILVTSVSPAVAFEGRRIAFLFLPDLNLVEVVERSLP